MICYIAKQMGSTGGKQIITLLTNYVQQRLIYRVTVSCFLFGVITFTKCCLLVAFGGKQFLCQMSCDYELANEWARCSGKNVSNITVSILLCQSRSKIDIRDFKIQERGRREEEPEVK